LTEQTEEGQSSAPSGHTTKEISIYASSVVKALNGDPKWKGKENEALRGAKTASKFV